MYFQIELNNLQHQGAYIEIRVLVIAKNWQFYSIVPIIKEHQQKESTYPNWCRKGAHQEKGEYVS